MNAMNSYIKKEVALIGANTAFGKMTSFLLKQSPLLSKLTLYDDKNLKPLDDIKYINTPCQVTFVNGREHMSEAIKNADIIIIGDDDPREMGHGATLMSRAPSFSNYIQQIANHNSDAIIVIATNPVNMTVPLAAEVLKNLGKLNERKLIGMTNVEKIKARTILAHHLQICPGTIDFPVIGGLTTETRVPLLSNMSPRIPLSKANLQKITCAVKTSTTKLHNTESSQESLNRAYATAKLIKSIITGLNGHPTVETVLSYQKIINQTDFFSLPVLLGENGIINHIPLPDISLHEKYLLSHAIACMAADSKKAKDCYYKLRNDFLISTTVPQNKLNKLKPVTILNKQRNSQYASLHNGTPNIFQHTESNETNPSDMKFKSTLDLPSNIHSSNQNKNKLESLNFEKAQKRYSVESKTQFKNTILSQNLYKKSKIRSVKEDKFLLEHKNIAKQYNASENISTELQEKNIPTENLEKFFTSNIVKMVNERQNRKRTLTGTSHLIRNQSEHNFNYSTKEVNLSSKCITQKDKHSDLFKTKSANNDDKYLTMNKTERKSVSDISFNISNDAKTSGKKYSLQTNQPHWILHSLLFKSEKYQTSKRPILSRYASSESNDNKIKKNQLGNPEEKIRLVATLQKPPKSTNESQDSLRTSYMSSEAQNEDIHNKELIYLSRENKNKHDNSLPKFPKEITSHHDTLLSRYMSPQCNYKEMENEKFKGFNSESKIKQVISLRKLQTNYDKTRKSSWLRDESSKSKDEGIKNAEFEGFNAQQKEIELDSLPKPQASKPVPSRSNNYDSKLPVPKFISPKLYDVQRKLYLNSKISSDTNIYQNLLQKQMNSISSGPKIASFRPEESESSFIVLQRKTIDFEMLDKTVRLANNRYDNQKLQLLTSNSKECLAKDKVFDKKLKPIEVKDSHWKNNYFKKDTENLISKITNQKTFELTENNVDHVRQQSTSVDKENDYVGKGEECEKHECKEIIDKNSQNSVDCDTSIKSKNQQTSTPFEYIKKETIIDHKEPSSERISYENDYYFSMKHENGPDENRVNSNINLKFTKQISNLDSETNSIHTEGVGNGGNSIEHKSSQESKNNVH